MAIGETAKDRLANFTKSLSGKKPNTEVPKAPVETDGASLAPAASLAPGARHAEFTQSVVRSASLESGTVAIQTIPLDLVIDSPFQPRKRKLATKDLEDLVRSIAANGQLEAIIVAPASGELAGKYHVHSGHRRCAALRQLGAATVRATVRADLDERSARRLVLGANLGREDLTAIEEADAVRAYMDEYKLEVAQAADELGLSRRHAFRLQTVWKASTAMLEIIRDHALAARSAELLVKLELRDGKRALRIARRFADGTMTLGALEAELAPKTGASAQTTRTIKDVELLVDKRRVRFTLNVPRGDLDPGQRERIRSRLAELLAHVGIGDIVAAEAEVIEVVSQDSDEVTS